MTAPSIPAGDSVLALDQGTTNSKALLVDAATGRILARGSAPVNAKFPQAGWVEQDGEQIWGATLEAVAKCLALAPQSARIAGVSISNQRESVAIWDAHTGQMLGPILGWQDARTAALCAVLAEGELGELVPSVSGLALDPMFSAPKMRWLIDHAVSAGHSPDQIRVGTIDTWLVHRLTGEFLAEAGNASRTMLLNLRDLAYDDRLLAGFGIPAAALAPVVASNAGFGSILPGLPIPAGTPVVAVLADSHSALYHHGKGQAGHGKATYGTGSSVMVPAELSVDGPVATERGISATLAWLTDSPVYAREGNVIATGAALAWAAGILTGGDPVALGALAAEVPDNGGISFVPAFSGLGAPYFDRSARSVWVGMTGGTTRAHLARSVFEAVAHQVSDVAESMLAAGCTLAELHADGGATASELLMQLQADFLDRPVRVSGVAEASALGAAGVAALALGADQWTTHEAARLVTPRTNRNWVTLSRGQWHDAMQRARLASATDPS